MASAVDKQPAAARLAAVAAAGCLPTAANESQSACTTCGDTTNPYYILTMAIRSFADKDTETVWLDRRVCPFQHIQAQAKRRLNVLNAATSLDDLRNNPGARLHKLRGDRAGQWAIAINEQYRITFGWKDGPVNVEITDYHR